jgi:hypothetical protein
MPKPCMTKACYCTALVMAEEVSISVRNAALTQMKISE